tara:strand:- start:314 stop:502 length:189 start_codon:yes stop_codon:yes gene_type:complete
MSSSVNLLLFKKIILGSSIEPSLSTCNNAILLYKLAASACLLTNIPRVESSSFGYQLDMKRI